MQFSKMPKGMRHLTVMQLQWGLGTYLPKAPLGITVSTTKITFQHWKDALDLNAAHCWIIPQYLGVPPPCIWLQLWLAQRCNWKHAIMGLLVCWLFIIFILNELRLLSSKCQPQSRFFSSGTSARVVKVLQAKLGPQWHHCSPMDICGFAQA